MFTFIFVAYGTLIVLVIGALIHFLVNKIKNEEKEDFEKRDN